MNTSTDETFPVKFKALACVDTRKSPVKIALQRRNNMDLSPWVYVPVLLKFRYLLSSDNIPRGWTCANLGVGKDFQLKKHVLM